MKTACFYGGCREHSGEENDRDGERIWKRICCRRDITGAAHPTATTSCGKQTRNTWSFPAARAICTVIPTKRHSAVFATWERRFFAQTSRGRSSLWMTGCRSPSIVRERSDRTHVRTNEDASYIGNINSKKYHLPSCRGLPNEENRVYFTTTDAAEKAGYFPCGNCHPDQ